MSKLQSDYSNRRDGDSPFVHNVHRMANYVRSFVLFHFLFPWVKYNGFVRVMTGTSFAKNKDIRIGDRVQFGRYCNISTDVHFGSNILLASRVSIIGRHDHSFDKAGMTIW